MGPHQHLVVLNHFLATTNIEVDLNGIRVVSEWKKYLITKFLKAPLGNISIGAVTYLSLIHI